MLLLRQHQRPNVVVAVVVAASALLLLTTTTTTTRFPSSSSPSFVALAMAAASTTGDGDGDGDNADAQDTTDDTCSIWVAPSTIPNAGLGAFNGDYRLAKGSTHGLDADQVAVPWIDVEFHNGEFKYDDEDDDDEDDDDDDDVIPSSPKRNKKHHHGKNWRDYLMNFFISMGDFDLDPHFPDDSHMMIPGTGSLPCSHFALNNVQEPGHLQVDNAMNHGDDENNNNNNNNMRMMHRSKDPGVGAFSAYHGYQTPIIRSIPPYAELFGSYGHAWFEEREETIGIVPLEEDWKEAGEFFKAFTLFWEAHKSHFLTEQRTMAEELWNLVVLSEHVDDFDDSLKDFVKAHSNKSPQDGISKETVEAISVLLEEALELEVAAIRALPRSWADAQEAMKAGGLEKYELQKSIRSKEWLQTHGRCMDGIIPGNSKIPQAGRGAFARRSFSTGDIVAHAPLLHVADRSMLNMYGAKRVRNEKTGRYRDQRDLDRFQGIQLALNYCFGRPAEESPLLFCPYGSSTPYINHSHEPNVKLVWATNTSWFDSQCLTKTPIELAYHFTTCLGVDYIALRDIAPGEEVLLDYGSDWEEAWNHHVELWEPHPYLAAEHPLYVGAAELNQDLTRPIRTLEEEEGGNPYSKNINIECLDSTRKAWYPCDIVGRKEVPQHNGQYEYEADILIQGPGIKDEDDERDDDDEDEVTFEKPKIERHEHLLRKNIRFVDEWYSGDEFLPNAFRHEMRLPDELFSDTWKIMAADDDDDEEEEEGPRAKASTEECEWQEEKYDFVSSPHLEPGQIEPIRWSDTKEAANRYSVRIGLDPKLSQELLAYAERLGIIEMYWDLLQRKEPMKPGSFEFFEFDPDDPDLQYYVNRPEKKWKSNMHWANAANEHTHEEFLKVLAKGNFDQVLEAMGKHFELDGLFVQGVSFIGVSHCEKGFIHHDMTETGGKFFNVLFPLVQVDNAPPEFVLRDDESEREGLAKYIANEAMAVGDDAYHGTAACDYQTGTNNSGTGIRVSASIYIADANEENIEEIVSDTTTIFPIPYDREWVMASRGRHWGGENRLAGDKGRKPITVKDKWSKSTCEELAQNGACRKDIWEMRANCVKTCRVFVDYY